MVKSQFKPGDWVQNWQADVFYLIIEARDEGYLAAEYIRDHTGKVFFDDCCSATMPSEDYSIVKSPFDHE